MEIVRRVLFKDWFYGIVDKFLNVKLWFAFYSDMCSALKLIFEFPEEQR